MHDHLLFRIAYYNAGSAALVLVLIALLIGGFLYWRSRKGGLSLRSLPLSSHSNMRSNEFEESIPLRGSGYGDADDHDRDRDGSSTLVGGEEHEGSRSRKGKERATTYEPTPKEEIFGVGDSDDEDGRGARH